MNSDPFIVIGHHPDHGWIVDGPGRQLPHVGELLVGAGFVYDNVLGTHRIPDSTDPYALLQRALPTLQMFDVDYMLLGEVKRPDTAQQPAPGAVPAAPAAAPRRPHR
ncbi:hypothetical protein AB0J38_25070 [Streptomyces sp. NPDC050095]|uniref:hypothetical protein n=1 Tax=unclassified Streptomyces TaxID=2593676 RepID=UPI003411F8CC